MVSAVQPRINNKNTIFNITVLLFMVLAVCVFEKK